MIQTPPPIPRRNLASLALAVFFLGACASTAQDQPVKQDQAQAESRKLEQDQQAILAMAGNFQVTFDFQETVPFVKGYVPKDRKISSGNEIVRVIRQDKNFISLQHILVVGGDDEMPIKHWRQDWVYEPVEIMEFVGGNAWKKRVLSPEERAGKWAQIVYQVDDAPRYAAVAAWTHENGVSSWASPPSLRPLPRRDATKRNDYHAIQAVNRHAITPAGWVHEQDNAKLIMTGKAQVLVHEIGVNTYNRFDNFSVDIGDKYWQSTAKFWAGVRAEWTRLEAGNEQLGLTIKGEPEELYMKILTLAGNVREGSIETSSAIQEARQIIDDYTTTNIGSLSSRVAQAE